MNRITRIALALVVLVSLGGGAAMASVAQDGFVAPTPAIVAFLADHGIEAASIAAPASSVPDVQWIKLLSLLRADNRDAALAAGHDDLNALVFAALAEAGADDDHILSIRIGDTIWTMGGTE